MMIDECGVGCLEIQRDGEFEGKLPFSISRIKTGSTFFLCFSSLFSLSLCQPLSLPLYIFLSHFLIMCVVCVLDVNRYQRLTSNLA